MKNKQSILVVILVAFFCVGASYYFTHPKNTATETTPENNTLKIKEGTTTEKTATETMPKETIPEKTITKNTESKIISEAVAIETIKNQFPEFKEYPSDKLAPTSIKTEKVGGGWYVAFVQEGSGRPIISATCFLVDNQKNISSKEIYNPTVAEDSNAKFSPVTCSPISFTSPSVCAVENCHGLDIQCGSNPPDVCTMIYQVGDKCLKYATCGVQNGTCGQTQNSQFTQCKTCVQKCIDTNKDDNIKLFECESGCE